MTDRQVVAGSKPVQLALQGGGSHGALTWGVLDRLLEESEVDIRAVSGTSAGAMNAVVLADGLARGGRACGRERLHRFWRSVAAAGALSPFRRGLWDRLAGRHSLDGSPRYLLYDVLGRLLSPHEINPLGINPLRPLLAEIDFQRLNGPDAIAVHVAATEVRTGRPRVFSRGELGIDAVLASACLPHLHGAVEIDGDVYWDGGFSANPALTPLVDSPAAPDLLIVALNPMVRHAVPSAARGIINRTNEITFNASLLNQLATIHALQQRRSGRTGRDVADIRLHLIEGGAGGDGLEASSKLDVEWRALTDLFERGRRSADAWLAAHQESIGVCQTLDLARFCEGARPAHDPSPEVVTLPPRRRRVWHAVRRWLHAA